MRPVDRARRQGRQVSRSTQHATLSLLLQWARARRHAARSRNERSRHNPSASLALGQEGRRIPWTRCRNLQRTRSSQPAPPCFHPQAPWHPTVSRLDLGVRSHPATDECRCSLARQQHLSRAWGSVKTMAPGSTSALMRA
ncbi:hypothetical protein KVR01_006948 [Diaporthe batatas]|uniref:uncharacterized protein n=1 Tax=Diaporthe batatas TaxID=748121 RepID=UPI001D04182A|nr:uncharacterized protein KVR01_006948 [Diaporthe batatas]KAG8163651.1 hypothetical protein KVR01_006948 [Diaporthe batatas]